MVEIEQIRSFDREKSSLEDNLAKKSMLRKFDLQKQLTVFSKARSTLQKK